MVKVPLPLNASTKHYQQTQALMGATRLASGIKERLIHYKQRLTDSSNYTSACKPFPKCPDAGRVAPIRGSVWCLSVLPLFKTRGCKYDKLSRQQSLVVNLLTCQPVNLLTCQPVSPQIKLYAGHDNKAGLAHIGQVVVVVVGQVIQVGKECVARGSPLQFAVEQGMCAIRT